MTVIFAPAQASPPIEPTEDAWGGMAAIVWEDWAGREWSLCGNAGVMLGPRVRGLDFGSLPHDSIDLAGVDGAEYLGYSAESRDVWLQITTAGGSGTQSWIDHDARVRSAFLPAIRDVTGRGYIRKHGRLRMVQPNGTTRWLDLWPVQDGSNELTGYGWLFGRETYGQSFKAYRPWWYGPELQPTVIAPDDSTEFWSGDPYEYSASRTFGVVPISNPGDTWSWPRWRISGPCTSATIGPVGREAVVPVTLAAGQWLDITTDPLDYAITREDGTSPRMRMGGWPFAPIPPMDEAHVTCLLTGSGSISVTLTPNYHRYA